MVAAWLAVADKLLGAAEPSIARLLLLRPWSVRTNQVYLDAPTWGAAPFPWKRLCRHPRPLQRWLRWEARAEFTARRVAARRVSSR